MLILSGGVSMGRFDYVPQVLAELDVRVVFHKVSQRPGKPLWFGVGAGGQTVYALPGNPVSTLVCLARYVFAGLETSLGAAARPPESIALGQALRSEAGADACSCRCKSHFRDGAAPAPCPTDARLRRFHLADRHRRLRGTAARARRVIAAGTPVPLYSW